MLCYLNRGKKISFLLQHKSLVYFLACIAKIVLKSRLFFQGHFKTFGFAYYVVYNHFIMKMRSILLQKKCGLLYTYLHVIVMYCIMHARCHDEKMEYVYVRRYYHLVLIGFIYTYFYFRILYTTY